MVVATVILIALATSHPTSLLPVLVPCRVSIFLVVTKQKTKHKQLPVGIASLTFLWHFSRYRSRRKAVMTTRTDIMNGEKVPLVQQGGYYADIAGKQRYRDDVGVCLR